jgi:outer membrane lipopolysaccharide assembly protein LptE/RlpB
MDQHNSSINRAGDANEVFMLLTVEQAVEAMGEAASAIAVDVEVTDALVEDEDHTLLMVLM